MFMGVLAMFLDAPNWRFAFEPTQAELDEATRAFGAPRMVAMPSAFVIQCAGESSYRGMQVSGGAPILGHTLTELADQSGRRVPNEKE